MYMVYLVPKIDKELLQLNKKTTQLKNRQRTLIDIVPKKTDKWPVNREKLFNVSSLQGNAKQSHKIPLHML